MRTIILGREGNQPFKINDTYAQVSRHHAEISISDNGQWILKDTASSYGTHIRDEETGEWIRVGNHQSIHEMTYIKLGGDRAKSCCFFARQAVNYGDFRKEYKYLRKKKQELEEKRRSIISFQSKLTLIKTILPFCCFGLIILIFGMEMGTVGLLFRMGLSAIPTAIIQVVFDPKKEMEKINEKKKKLFFCPNPLCGKRITDDEIEAGACNKCKK